MYDEDDIDNSAFIPLNYDEDGKILDGMFKIRNAIEAGVLFYIVKFIVEQFNTIEDKSIHMAVKFLVPGTIAILGLLGYQGDSLSQTIQLIFNYYKNRRRLKFRRIKKQSSNNSSVFGNKKVKAKNKTNDKKKKTKLFSKKKDKTTKKEDSEHSKEKNTPEKNRFGFLNKTKKKDENNQEKTGKTKNKNIKDSN